MTTARTDASQTAVDGFRGPLARAGVGAILLASLVVLQNLFGYEVNELVLRMPGIDKALHFAEYLVVFRILHWLLRGTRRAADPSAPAAAAALAIALLDETVQQWGPSRNVEALDLAADACGVAFGWATLRAPGLARVGVAAAAIAGGALITYDSHLRTRDFARGLLSERQHDYRAARRHYARALQAGLKTPGLYNSLGWVEIESGEGDPAQAVAYAREALSMRPHDPDVLDTYGWALHHAGRHEEALRHLLLAYAAKPRMFCIHYHLGSVYLALGRDDLAKSHLREQTALAGTREAVLAARVLDTMAESQP